LRDHTEQTYGGPSAAQTVPAARVRPGEVTMTDNVTHPQEPPLESWKEIAAYLKRDVRTVIRWEKSEGLPVHRQMHQARSSVYAYPSELDAWKIDREPRLNAPILVTPWRRATAAVGFALTVLLSLVSVASGPILNPAIASAQGIVTRQVWAGPEADTMGSPSPDGRLLSFVDWNTGDLAIRDLTTGKSRRLTNKGPWFQSYEYAYGSRVSPDGKYIVYTWDRYPSPLELRLVGTDGTGARVLYSNPELWDVEPRDWSPDGKNILVLLTRKDHVNQIALVSAANGSAKVLKNLDSRAPLMMAFSPDGRYIAYDFPPQEASENRDIYLLASDGSRETPLIEHPANDFLLGWAPGDAGVLFASDRTGAFDAWMVRLEDGRPEGRARLVKQGVGRIIPMGFTRDGSYYYGVESGSDDIYLATLDPRTGAVLEPPVPVAQRFMGSNRTPVFSPDGRSLAYLSRRTPIPAAQGPVTMVVRSLEDGAEKEFELGEISNRSALTSWSSNGRRILISAFDRRGGQGLYMVDVTSGAVTPVVRSEPGEFRFDPEWSPDNQRIYFIHTQTEPKLQNLAVRDFESGRETELVRAQNPSFIRHFALSPDGHQLAFTWEADGQKKGCLKVIPSTGGEARELFCPDEAMIFYRTVRWTPDGRYILFGQKEHSDDIAHHQAVELWRIPADGGQPQKLGLAADLMRFLVIHPDGRRVAFTAGQYAAEVWVMENFLPGLAAVK
jgi:Tol biopolymer transport system component